MMKILFICHGNICRSPAAEIVLCEMAHKSGLSLTVDSAATTWEEIGNGIYPPMKRVLTAHGYPMNDHRARRTTREDYACHDLIIGMDEENMRDLHRIYGGDPDSKISMLMSWAGMNREVSDPWYTRDFECALQDIEQGCRGLIRKLTQ